MGACYGELLVVCTFSAVLIGCLCLRYVCTFLWGFLLRNARSIRKVIDADSDDSATETQTDSETDPETYTIAFMSSDSGCDHNDDGGSSGKRHYWGLCCILMTAAWLSVVYHWRRRAVAIILSAEMSEEERDAVVKVHASQERFVQEARNLYANGSWPAMSLEFDLVGAGGGFRSAANGAGVSLLLALQRAGLIGGVQRTRGASSGASASILSVSKLWEPEGFISWILRQPRYFRETIGASIFWRLIIPFETWFTPSILQALDPGDYKLLSGRSWVAYTRGCLRGGFHEAEIAMFDSNEAVTAALSKSMMVPFVYPLWNTLFGLRNGEIVLDAGVSRDYPLFIDGLRPQIVLAPRRELNTYVIAPLPQMVASLINSQSDIFDLLRRWDGRPSRTSAVEIVPSGVLAAHCANARLNDWPLFNTVRRLFVSAPDVSEGDAAEAWRIQIQFAFKSNDSILQTCTSMAPADGDVEPAY